MADVAAFDFDGTLTDGGSVFAFLAAVTDRRTVVAASVPLVPRLAHAALVGGDAADRTKELLFRHVLAGVGADALAEVSRRFAAEHLAAHLRTDVARRLEWHRRRGDRVVIVSASPECYVSEAGRRLEVDGVIATRLEVGGDGRLTGRYDGRNCRGAEKLRRLEAWIAAEGGGSPTLWAYGNSRGDLRMLRAADVGVDVGRLGPVGRLRAFPRLPDVDGAAPGR